MKRKHKKSFNWYGLRQRFSIRKYHFGAASVLIGTALVFAGGPTAQADEQKATEPSSAVVEGKPDSNTSQANVAEVKAEKPVTPVVEKTTTTEAIDKKAATEIPVVAKETPKTEETKEVAKEAVIEEKATEVKPATEEKKQATVDTTSLDKEIRLLDSVFVALAGKDLTQAQQDEVVKAAEVLNKAKEVLAEAKSSEEVSAKTTEVTKVRESLEKILTEAEKEAAKAKDTTKSTSLLEKSLLEAGIINETAVAYANKTVKDEKAKVEILAAVNAAKKEIEKANAADKNGKLSAEQKVKQKELLDASIERVTNAMKAAGHGDKFEAVLADVSSTVKTPEKTRVRNTSALTDEEVEGIIRQVRIANPNLTDADKISVFKNSGSANNAGEVTITYANGDTAKIASGDAVIGAGVARNVEGLKDAINWFEFSAASIVYPDGTEVGPARYLSTPKRIQVDHPREDGTKVTANLNIVRDVKYTDGTTGLTTDDRFLKSGITEFTVHEYYTGGFQNNNEAYEVLKEGMVLKVPTRVKGYNLTLRVEKLAPKQVATDPNNTATRGKNAMNAQQGEDKRFKPVKMILTTQDTTNSYLYKAGMKITDKNNKPALATITTNRDGANAGVTFSASATFNGQPVPVNLVAADGEESGRAEVLQFETNGSNWKELMSINLTEKQQTAEGGYKLGGDVTALTAGTLDFYAGYTRNNVGYNAKEWVNRVQDTDAQGNPRYDSSGQPIMKEVVYGSKLFGPTWNAMRQGNALGFGFSEDVTQFSMYMNSAGAQAGSIGFVVYDGGDAPQSYGSAQHVIGSLNRVDSSGRQVVASQPYFGSEPGDPDFRSTATDPSGAWVLDDLVSTNGYKVVNMKEGNTVTNEAGETGTYKLVDVNGRKTPVLLKADGSTTALKQVKF